MGLWLFWRTYDSTWRQPDTLTLLLPVEGRFDELDALLEGADLGLAAIEELHFLRMFLVPQTTVSDLGVLPAGW